MEFDKKSIENSKKDHYNKLLEAILQRKWETEFEKKYTDREALAGKLDIKREGHIIKIGEYQSYLTEEIAYLNKKIDCLTDILADI